MVPSLSDVTFIVVNYQTPDLTTTCYQSLRYYYPEIAVIVVDNGSHDNSANMIHRWAELHPQTKGVWLMGNKGHGPGLHAGVMETRTPFFFSLDSDTEVKRGEFLGPMLQMMTDPEVYVVGRVVQVDDTGHRLYEGQGIPYCHPCAALWHRSTYMAYPPFELHGAPALRNQRRAMRWGHRPQHFPIDEYIHHKTKGTRSRYGTHWHRKGQAL